MHWLIRSKEEQKAGLLTNQILSATDVEVFHAPLMVGLVEHVSLGDQKLEVVKSFVYLGDRTSPNMGREVSTLQEYVLLAESSLSYFPC